MYTFPPASLPCKELQSPCQVQPRPGTSDRRPGSFGGWRPGTSNGPAARAQPRRMGSAVRVRLGIAVATALALATWGCGDVGSHTEPSPTIAGAAPGTFLEAMRFAVHEAGDGGSLEGLDTVFVSEASNRSGPALAVAQELVDTPGIAAVVGHANSAASLATSQVYNRSRVVQIAPTSSAPLYSEAGPFSFRLVPPDDGQGRFLAQVVSDSLQAGARLAVFYVNDDYGRGLRAGFLEALDIDGYPVVVDLPHTEDDLEPVDTQHLLEALDAAEVQALIWLGRVPQLNNLIPGLRSSLGDLPVIGGDALSRARLVTDRHPGWAPVMFADFLDMEATSELRAFSRRFQDQRGFAPGPPEALSYDGVGLLLAAIREGARTGDDIRAYLESLGRDRPPYQGVTGPVEFDPNGDVRRDYALTRVGPEEDR